MNIKNNLNQPVNVGSLNLLSLEYKKDINIKIEGSVQDAINKGIISIIPEDKKVKSRKEKINDK